MREILFRAFVKDKCKIYDIKKIDFDYGMVWFEEENKPTDTMRMFDQIELMQFTGLTDKNGKKIFEGDIVKIHPYHSAGIHTEAIAIVCFDRGAFSGKISDHNPSSLYMYEKWRIEVVGNIHDNPELLEQER